MNANASYVSILDSDEVNGIMAGRSALLSDTLDTNNRYPAAVAIKNGLDIYYSIANSGSYDATVYQNEQLTAHIRETGDIGDYVVVTTDIDILNEYLAYDNITYVSYEDTYFIAGK
jgi:hypothetical protein